MTTAANSSPQVTKRDVLNEANEIAAEMLDVIDAASRVRARALTLADRVVTEAQS